MTMKIFWITVETNNAKNELKISQNSIIPHVVTVFWKLPSSKKKREFDTTDCDSSKSWSILERGDPSSVASTWDGMTTKIRLVIFQKIFFAFVAAILFFLFFFFSFFLPRFPGFLSPRIAIFLGQSTRNLFFDEREIVSLWRQWEAPFYSRAPSSSRKERRVNVGRWEFYGDRMFMKIVIRGEGRYVTVIGDRSSHWGR